MQEGVEVAEADIDQSYKTYSVGISELDFAKAPQPMRRKNFEPSRSSTVLLLGKYRSPEIDKTGAFSGRWSSG